MTIETMQMLALVKSALIRSALLPSGEPSSE